MIDSITINGITVERTDDDAISIEGGSLIMHQDDVHSLLEALGFLCFDMSSYTQHEFIEELEVQ